MPARCTHRSFIRLGACALLGIGAGVCAAQPEPLAPLVEQLDSATLGDREDATRRIPRIPGLRLSDVEGVLSGGDLSTEQRVRLERIAEDLFASTTRAGMGVRFALDSGDRVALAGVVNDGNFPAAEVLRAGDLFLEVDGHERVTQEWLKNWIISHTPGESLRCRVLRDGEEIVVDVPLGSYDNLGNPGGLDQTTIERAYRLRRERIADGIEPVAVIAEELSASDWIRASYPGEAFGTDPRPVAVLSGHTVAGLSEWSSGALGWTGLSLHLLHPLSLTGDGYPEVMPIDLRADLLDRLQRSRESLERRADQLQELLDRRQFDEEGTVNIRQQIQASRAQSETLRERIEALESIPTTPGRDASSDPDG
ncbi:MAG: PDZ domain-containing protein [Phycisphaerales bacterium JB040]